MDITRAMKALKVLLVYFVSLPLLSKGELFTALVDLEKLLHTEGEIVRTLEKYLAVEEQRLQKVRWLRGEYDKLHRKASEDVQTFLSNPVNAYLLVKRLTADWKTAENLVQGLDSKALIENITQNRQDLQFPDDEDLSGAAVALIRLQDTYKLDTASLARGDIEGAIRSPELTAGDCYELGRQAYYRNDFYHTLLWMQEALNRLEQEESKTADKAEILEYIAWCAYKLGDMKEALKVTKDLLDFAPDHARGLVNLKFYQDAVDKMIRQEDSDDGTSSSKIENTDVAFDFPVGETYLQLCRGERLLGKKVRGHILPALMPKPLKEEAKLSCRFFMNDDPYLLLQPVKEEELLLKPRVVVYHNFLTENEMKVIKALAQPKLKRATVHAKPGQLEIASYRISKSAWLEDADHPSIAAVSRRIQAVTGLTTKTAEELQVVNYGIGGHYEPHYDFARESEEDAFKNLRTGNRIATWLNYMSDVEAGGATVFPQLGIGVKPEKGAAAFWYNLRKDGGGDYSTIHAACPVLAGSKWVSNKWFHEHGQEFRKKCSLNPGEQF